MKTPNMPTPRELSTGEVMRRLCVDRSTIWRWCDKGVLPFRKNDFGHRMIDERAVNALVSKAKNKIERK